MAAAASSDAASKAACQTYKVLRSGNRSASDAVAGPSMPLLYGNRSPCRHTIPTADRCAWRRTFVRMMFVPLDPFQVYSARLPSRVGVVLADEVYIDRSCLPPSMVARLVRLAAFQNPEFYRAQAMRLPTFGKPRIVSCAALHPRHVALPRGCLDEAIGLLRSHGVEADIEDRREGGAALSICFLGALREGQVAALNALACHDFGVLAATTAFGKTIVAAALIAQRGCSTLVLVHRRELLTQWTERLKTRVSIPCS
jgi:hypothetical protein